MHSLISIVCVVLTGKEYYREWYRNIKITLIFNELWKRICKEATVLDIIIEEEAGSCFESIASESKSKSNRSRSKPEIPTSNKECVIWEDKD
jgi:hypothetical protein